MKEENSAAASSWNKHIILLLIDRHKQEVFGENVHVARPRLHPSMPHVTVAATQEEEEEVTHSSSGWGSALREAAVFLRDGGGVALTSHPPSAQLFEEEAAEHVTPLSHRTIDILQEEIPVVGGAFRRHLLVVERSSTNK